MMTTVYQFFVPDQEDEHQSGGRNQPLLAEPRHGSAPIPYGIYVVRY